MTGSILVTGGTGTFGRAFTEHLLRNTGIERICIYSRSEHMQADMAQNLMPEDLERMRFFIGDVRDLPRLRRAMTGVTAVVHAAALKRIEVGHYNPVEMVKTNVNGAINVIEAAQDANVQKVVALSTDKAFEPVSPYGQTKALAESLFLAANDQVAEGGPRFAVVRYGNIWRSAGSVVPKWERLSALNHQRVPITDPNCTRFFMTTDQACELVHLTVRDMKGGEIAIPDLPAYKLGDLARAMRVKTDKIGLPSWEKLHESMSADKCSKDAPRMTVDDLKEELRRAAA